MRVAVDVGGTFTDVITLDEATDTLRLEKVETTPHDPASGVLQGFHKANARLNAVEYFVHGTTLGLNALLTRTGARVAIVTTKGFRDVYELGRTSRDPMYDLKYRKPPTLVPRFLAFEVTERCDFQGNVLTSLDRSEARSVARQLHALGVEAVAVCFLHSYANPEHELLMEEVLRQECPHILVSLSHQLSREYREYERTSTVVLDAYIKPVIRGYLATRDNALRVEGFAGRFLLTRSGGGAMTVTSASEQPVHTVLSGPAGGVIGAQALSQLLRRPNFITLDMGGTSLDAALIVEGRITTKHESSNSHYEDCLSEGTEEDYWRPLTSERTPDEQSISCPQCSRQTHRNGATTYSHRLLTPVIVAPHQNKVIPLPPEFIVPQDGHAKQDCENAAAKRWLRKYAATYRTHKMTILGDDLYATQPICEVLIAERLPFILVCKPDSHPTLYAALAQRTLGKDLHQLTHTVHSASGVTHATYRYASQLPLRASADTLLVNWCELTLTDAAGTQLYHNAFMTQAPLTAKTVAPRVQAGRTRWKVENENNNTLKTQGYHLEHNFGHGTQPLAALLATFNLLAFLFHTLLDLLDAQYHQLRRTLVSRKTFFDDLRALTRYLCFTSWVHLLAFMHQGLHGHPPLNSS